MRHIIDPGAFPIDEPNASKGAALVDTCPEALAARPDLRSQRWERS